MTPTPRNPEDRPIATLLAPDIVALLEESPADIPAETEEIHPADLAQVAELLEGEQLHAFLTALGPARAADVLEYLDYDLRTEYLESVTPRQAAELVTEMTPDDRADTLEEIDEDRVEEILSEIPTDARLETEKLLAYEPDTAGGLMTTDYVVLDQAKTVADALEAVRDSIKEDIRAAYVYCVADASRDECILLGMVALWDLLVAPQAQTLQELMETDIVTVTPDADPRTVAEIMAKYNLLAVPVVNAAGVLEGIVTVDDALDVLLPPERRRKPTRMY